ncbi:TPT-domain-containing protein [Epithele typhae]|uniref:TPT-domain-containing protein n=1 Tax=Epithele typhae TaxID=378194 RepID=UPI0020080525|nr:TPT-domain-containing protein [Epithele typhae]KAH9940463.1 TPT-domain-containing protein [Epithele typhae]
MLSPAHEHSQPPRRGQYQHVAGSDPSIDAYDPASIHIASLAEKRRLWWANAIINCLFIAAWFFFAILLSLYNKWMFSPDRFGFPSPFLVTTAHMWVQFSLAALLRYALPRHFRPDRNPSRQDYIRKVMPTGMTTGLDIGLSNVSLRTITLSFYTMCKSSSLVFVLLFAFLLRLERFSWLLIGVIFFICSGVLLMVATETHFELVGFLLVTTASALGGLRWGLTQLLMRNRDLGLSNPAATLFWLAPIMGTTLLIAFVLVDGWHKVFDTHFFATPADTMKTAFFVFSPGAIAFCMVLSEFYIIQRAGMVPLSIAGIAKEVTTIMCSAWIFGDELTPLNMTGVGITVCGIGLYTWHKYKKSMEKNVALDPHGNPLPDEDDISANGDLALEGGELGERQRLTADVDDEPDENDDEREDSAPRHQGNGRIVEEELLFSVVDDEDDGDREGEQPRSKPAHAANGSPGAGALPPPYPGDDGVELHQVWGEGAARNGGG